MPQIPLDKQILIDLENAIIHHARQSVVKDINEAEQHSICVKHLSEAFVRIRG